MKVGQPIYVHDCRKCTYLGVYFSRGRRKWVDLYFCTVGVCRTVIARYSSEGADCVSGLFFADQLPDLKEARRRAIAMGLLPEVL